MYKSHNSFFVIVVNFVIWGFFIFCIFYIFCMFCIVYIFCIFCIHTYIYIYIYFNKDHKRKYYKHVGCETKHLFALQVALRGWTPLRMIVFDLHFYLSGGIVLRVSRNLVARSTHSGKIESWSQCRAWKFGTIYIRLHDNI